MSNLPLEEVFNGCSKAVQQQQPQQQQQQQEERRARPQPEQALKCPRCDSSNTKFCYYNNYSLSQPRYFCKGCRRYWTKGGSLRNVPVGGGCRRNKRSSSSSSSSMSSKKLPPEQSFTTSAKSNPPLPSCLLQPPLSYDPNDLTLSFARLQRQHNPGQLLDHDHEHFLLGNPNPSHVSLAPNGHSGLLDIFKTEFLDTSTAPTGFNNLNYYNYGGGNGIVHGEVVFPFDSGFGSATTPTATIMTTSTQGSSCKAMDNGAGGGDGKVLMGMQWQVGGNGNMAMDSGKDHWINGVNGSTWHGLINSSLM